MYSLQSSLVTAIINPLGAELQKLVRKDLELDYLWSGDPAYWGKFSPVLFPIVGTLRGNHYRYNGTDYTLPRHGFAREKMFTCTQLSEHQLECTLVDDESTRVVYPFRFVLRITYTLTDSKLTVTYTVNNPDDKPLYFSIGAHPAFALPLESGLAYTDYRLRFSQKEHALRWGLQDGLLLDSGESFLENQSEIAMDQSLFSKDAIVLKNLRSHTLTLETPKSTHGLCFSLEEWPHLGLWAAKDAPFLCIEPWQGHADTVHHNGDFKQKPGIVELAPMEEWERSWWVELF